MDKRNDWLEETWEIKRAIAEKYTGKPMSEQLRDMHVSVLEEFRKRGWNYPDAAPAANIKVVNTKKS
jgi:hypothetical protein